VVQTEEDVNRELIAQFHINYKTAEQVIEEALQNSAQILIKSFRIVFRAMPKTIYISAIAGVR